MKREKYTKYLFFKITVGLWPLAQTMITLHAYTELLLLYAHTNSKHRGLQGFVTCRAWKLIRQHLP